MKKEEIDHSHTHTCCRHCRPPLPPLPLGLALLPWRTPLTSNSCSHQAAGYPPDEAASKERLEYRLQHGEPAGQPRFVAGWDCRHSCLPRDVFLCAFLLLTLAVCPLRCRMMFGRPMSMIGLSELCAECTPACAAAGAQFLTAVQPAGDGALRIVGFVCGTLSHADKLTLESMGVHEADGGKSAFGLGGGRKCFFSDCVGYLVSSTGCCHVSSQQQSTEGVRGQLLSICRGQHSVVSLNSMILAVIACPCCCLQGCWPFTQCAWMVTAAGREWPRACCRPTNRLCRCWVAGGREGHGTKLWCSVVPRASASVSAGALGVPAPVPVTCCLCFKACIVGALGLL